MAKRQTVFGQLTSAGESALEQLAASPVGRKAAEAAMQAKDRVEKLVANLADIDGRVSRIEKRLDALEKARKSASKPRATASKTAPKT